MVYGVLQLINFAHGDVFMVGAMLTLVLGRGRSGSSTPAGRDISRGCVRARARHRDHRLRRARVRSSSGSPTARCATSRASTRSSPPSASRCCWSSAGSTEASSGRRRSRFPPTCCPGFDEPLFAHRRRSSSAAWTRWSWASRSLLMLALTLHRAAARKTGLALRACQLPLRHRVADGHQHQPHHQLHVRPRLVPGGRRRACCTPSSTRRSSR